MVEVFSTNVISRKQAAAIVSALSTLLPEARINFDLADCDRILRVEQDMVSAHQVIAAVNQYGFQCEVLEDNN